MIFLTRWRGIKTGAGKAGAVHRRIFKLVPVFIGLLNIGGGISPRAQSLDIFVSVHGNDRWPGTLQQPVNTLHRAQQLLRSSGGQHAPAPANIFLRAGTYYLDSPLVFTPKDNPGGNRRIVIQSYGREKATISGGRRLHLTWIAQKNGIYRARLSAAFHFDQLFVNGVKQVRARYPNYDASATVFHGVSGKALSPARIRSWQRPAGGLIHALQKSHWGSLSYLITGKLNEEQLRVRGGYQINRSGDIDSGAVFVENIREELDTAHEWYYDDTTRTLYYMPPADLDLRKAKVEVPVLMELVVLRGNIGQPLKNIHFKGITFAHTTETFMYTREPLLRGDWNIFRGGAVLLSGTETCTFDHCNFEAPGGNAIFFNTYNRNDTVRHCLIRNAGASGICFAGDPFSVRSPSFGYHHFLPYTQLDKNPGPKNNNFPTNCYIYDNLIYNTGQTEKQTAGITLSMCMDIHIVHNTIYHVPRAGININDGCWGGHMIRDNDVFETVLETGDHGAFNSWGRDHYWSPERPYMDSLAAMHPELIRLDAIEPTVIRHNRFRCDNGWDIDLDDGSANYIIDSNLCLNGGIKNREGFYRTVKNNIMVNNTFHPHVWFNNSGDKFMHNVVMRPYAPIRVNDWGDTIDYNLFPDSASLAEAQSRGTDRHSVVSSFTFYNPAAGDFRIKENNVIVSSGFQNFSMNDFGVVSSRLKAIARLPEFPVPASGQGLEKRAGKPRTWEGAALKEIAGLDEQSAMGLPAASGIYIIKLPENAAAYQKGFRRDDVILMVEDKAIRSLSDFEQALEKYRDKPLLHMKIYRQQQAQSLLFPLK